jgi:iron complex transport system ATP-binding protein
MIMVTHHLEEIPAGFTHALILVDGQIFAAGEIDYVLDTVNISEAFGMNIVVDKVEGRFRARAHA